MQNLEFVYLLLVHIMHTLRLVYFYKIILNHIMKYHFKRMLQHNTFDTQRLLNICLKKYNLKNHKREKK